MIPGMPTGLSCHTDQMRKQAERFNLVAYLLWALFGFGLGTLIHSHIGAVVTAMIVYLRGFVGGIGVFNLIRTYLIHGDWVLTSAVIMPPIASQAMVSPDTSMSHRPEVFQPTMRLARPRTFRDRVPSGFPHRRFPESARPATRAVLTGVSRS
jgi:hypothetical protein